MPRILVIDDDAAMRTTLKAVLEKNGYLVAEAANGFDGLTVVEAGGVDLVLTDLVMPEQEGLETIKDLRKRFPAVKIIAMTGGGPMIFHDLLPVAKKFGANGCLAKPFENETLLAEIQRVMNAA